MSVERYLLIHGAEPVKPHRLITQLPAGTEVVLAKDYATLEQEARDLAQALDEALEVIANTIPYKSEYLVGKHGDKEEFERLKVVHANWLAAHPEAVSGEEKTS